MAKITAAIVKELREKTGLSMGECKKALVETDGNVEKAIDYLRKKGMSAASNKAHRKTSQGLISSYIHAGGKIGVLCEVNCETDFVARNEDFQVLVKDICMHIAAAEPKFIKKEEVTEEILNKEKEIFLAQAMDAGKPENIAKKIVEGKLSKYYEENCLYEQSFVKNPDVTVGQLISTKIAEIGENIVVNKFSRFVLGDK